MLELIKGIIPKPILQKIRPVWHGFLAYAAAVRYGFPSNKVVVIGITGTSGKSTTAAMLAHILNQNGRKAGYISTVGFHDSEKLTMNKHGLSMPGRFLLQKQLNELVRRGCSHAIIEATSEGLAQNRHFGINFDAALFTNLAPAHLDAHGSYENYRAAKTRLFKAVEKSAKKKLRGEFVAKIIGANLDDLEAEKFLSYKADKKFGIIEKSHTVLRQAGGQDVKAYHLSDTRDLDGKVEFILENVLFSLPALGAFNAYNAALAASAADMLGIDLAMAATALLDFGGVPGRMELIPNDRGIKIVLDYAPEPAGMLQALQTVNHAANKEGRIIHVFGSTGGHRDKAKRFEFGEISARLADIIIITNDDVYDSDPEEIAANIKEGVERISRPERRAVEVITILDRTEAIRKALTIAEQSDIVLITGKGSEQFLVLPGDRRVPWDERELIAKALTEK